MSSQPDSSPAHLGQKAHDVVQGSVTQTHSAKNEFIHGLRGLLAFGVFCFHIENSGLPTFHGPIADLVNLFFGSMRHGVEIFFGISGIVIFYSYQTSRSNRAFLVNRMTRILPVLWATIFIILGGARFDHRHDDSFSHFGVLGVLANYLALPTLIPLEIINPTAWTLSYEFAFYLCFVAFTFIVTVVGQSLGVPLCALIALALLATHLKALLFLVGIVIVIGTRRFSTKPLPFQFPLVLIALSMVIWDSAFSILGRRSDDITLAQLFHAGYEPVLLFVTATCLASMGLGGVFSGKGEARFLKGRIMRWLGTISFSLYMWQPITAAITKKFIVQTHLDSAAGNWSQILFFLMALPTTLFVAHFSQVFIEDRFTQYLRNIFHTPTQTRSAIHD